MAENALLFSAHRRFIPCRGAGKTQRMIVIVLTALCALFVYSACRAWQPTLAITSVCSMACYLGLPVMDWRHFGLPVLVLATGAATLAWAWRHGRASYLAAVVSGWGLAFSSVVPFISSWTGFYDKDYRQLIAAPAGTMTIPLIDVTVDRQAARQYAGAMLAVTEDLRQHYRLGQLTLQHSQGSLQWIAPLAPKSGWQQAAPAYISVSAQAGDSSVVREAQGKAIVLRYHPAAGWRHDLKRHIYLHGYHDKAIANIHLETDNAGRPWWVATVLENKVGFFGADAVGVLTIDPASGHIQQFSLNDAPAWLDQIQPSSVVAQQLRHYYQTRGKSLEDMRIERLTLRFDNRGHAYWVTTITGVGILVDARSKTVWFVP